ncbi:MAG: MFS transporter [Candidatus Levyibacteriota bacterium]
MANSKPNQKNNHPTIAFIALCLGFFMTILDVTIVNVALVDIKTHLGGNINALQWILDGYALVYASFLLTTGALGDRLGNKRIFIVGLGLFTLASILCGLAPTLLILELGRLLQGLGAALLVPNSLALINHTFADEKKKATALGIYGAIGGLGAAVGPVLGGLLVHSFSWRSIFIVNFPVGIICFLLTFFFVKESQNRKQAGFDIPGQVAGITALSLLTFAFIEGKGLGWHSPIIIGIFVSFAIAAILFLVREHKTKTPMLPLAFFSNLTFSGANTIGFLAFFALYGELFIVSLFFQQIQHYSPLTTGMAFLPEGLALFIPTLFIGKLVGSIGVKVPILIGLVIGCLGYAGLAFITARTSYLFVAAAIGAIGLAMAFIVPPITNVIVTNVQEKYSGIASSIYNVSRQIGAVLGVAILGSLIGSHKEFIQDMHLAFLICAALLFIALVIGAIFVKGNK